MNSESNKPMKTSADDRHSQRPSSDQPQYDAPALYVIGRAHDLLQGSGRHKNDDTGSRGFTVDQR